MRVTDEHDQPQATYFTSKPIYVTLELDLETVSPSLSIGIDIATVDGLIVFHTTFRDVPEHSAPKLAPGRNALRCEIPAELLNSGRYVVNLRISLHTIRWIVYADAVVHFDVLADHSESLFLIGVSRPGVVLPRVNWTAVEPDSTSERLPVPMPGTVSVSG